jgi:hypothetical protein
MVRTFAAPVESAEDFPSHCTKCGRALVFDEVTVGFSSDTGAPILRAEAHCRASWFDRLWGWEDVHDRFIVSPRPPVATPMHGAE